MLTMFAYAAVLMATLSLHVRAVPSINDHSFNCFTMMPTTIEGDPEKRPSPFFIVITGGTYKGGDEVRVDLQSTRSKKFTSFIIQARRLDDKLNIKHAIGQWRSLDKITSTLCTNSLQSDGIEPHSNITLEWVAPVSAQGHVLFVATFVDDESKFWVMEKSDMLKDPTAKPIPYKARYKPSPPIEPVHTDVCGTEKGCYRVPEECWEKNCEYLFTWANHGNEVEFELSVAHDGNDDRWAAAALSHDTYMGDDSVMECVQDAQTGKVEVFRSKAPAGAKYTKRLENYKSDIMYEEGSYYHGRLRCRFRMSKYSRDSGSTHPLVSNSYYILMARGIAHDLKIQRHKIIAGDYPVSSASKVSLQKKGNIGGYARYPLVKVHACLMLFAWIFCGTIGLLMVKYYKPMWPNSDFYGEKYWFTVHRSCMVTLVIAVVIAFILIFIHADGYSQHPDLPGRAHPILGIIVTVCVVINPILALLRPSENHRCRAVFNWFHFFFGIIANVLAVVNIFIGMGFGKANIPWWATWIVMLYFLFNLIIEVMLEVHMCWTHKKNKERMKKWDAEKKEYPKKYHPKPHPVGRIFKRNVLFTHITVTTVVTIILVITFAVC